MITTTTTAAASPITADPPTTGSGPASATPKARRQNSSCDSCRQRRKKCDAGLLGIDPLHPQIKGRPPQSCSGCKRAHRPCTFEWIARQKSRASFLPPQTTSKPPGRGTAGRVNRKEASPKSPPPASTPSFINTAPLPSWPVSSNPTSFEWTPIPDLSWTNYDPNIFLQPLETQGLPLLPMQSMPDQLADPGFVTTQEDVYDEAMGLPVVSNTSTDPFDAFNSIPLVENRLATVTAKRGITDTLIDIYRTNLEDVVGSWSTPLTCPLNLDDGFHQSSACFMSEFNFYESSTWLDKICPQLGLGCSQRLSLSPSQAHLATQALNKAILAFASQWNSAPAPSDSPMDASFAQELRSTMHKTLWHDAWTALQAAENIDSSCRLVFARIVFSFVHKEEFPGAPWGGRTTESEASLQLKKASSSLLQLRRELHHGFRSLLRTTEAQSTMQRNFMRQFNVLFWLAVMCDTTASAVNGSPLVIADEDCAVEHISVNSDEATIPRMPLWNSLLMGAQTTSTSPSQVSPFDPIAEDILKHAIPVKVLLFRHLASLRLHLSHGTPLEPTISAALRVHTHWEKTYTPFMTACMTHHAMLSPKFRSWHIILSAHWHYGVLLLTQHISGGRPDIALTSALSIARLASACKDMLSEPWAEIMVRSLSLAAETLRDACYKHSEDAGANSGFGQGIQACLTALLELGRCRFEPAIGIAEGLGRDLGVLRAVGACG